MPIWHLSGEPWGVRKIRTELKKKGKQLVVMEKTPIQTDKNRKIRNGSLYFVESQFRKK